MLESAYYQKDVCVRNLGAYFWEGLFLGELIFGGDYYRNFMVTQFCISVIAATGKMCGLWQGMQHLAKFVHVTCVKFFARQVTRSVA